MRADSKRTLGLLVRILVAVVLIWLWTEYIEFKCGIFKMRTWAKYEMENALLSSRDDPQDYFGPVLDLSVDNYITFEWFPKNPTDDSSTICVSFDPSNILYPFLYEPNVWGRASGSRANR